MSRIESVTARLYRVPLSEVLVDANYAMDVDPAIVAAPASGEFDLVWFEEPIVPDSYAGYGTIAIATVMPLAACRLPWASICIRRQNSIKPSNTPDWHSSTRTLRTAAASQVGSMSREAKSTRVVLDRVSQGSIDRALLDDAVEVDCKMAGPQATADTSRGS